MTLSKDRSPFYPGQPVPHEFFSGREPQVRQMERAIRQVAAGKPQALFLIGEYGIGKSSLAQAMRYVAESRHNLFAIHVLLGGAKNLNDLSERTLQAAIAGEAFQPRLTEKIRTALSRYVGKQALFGININFETIRADAPSVAGGYLPFLRALLERLQEEGTKGVMLVLDEINGITKNPDFAHFIKTLVDENALSRKPLPLLLVLCGVEERRLEMIGHHRPIDRIFELIRVEEMAEEDMRNFFQTSFASVGYSIDDIGLSTLCEFSRGYPKAMQILGDNTYWNDTDSKIDLIDVAEGINGAAREIGSRFIDHEVLSALTTREYKSLLRKTLASTAGMTFSKKMLERKLSLAEQNRLATFLRKLKLLRVIAPGEERGTYRFLDRLTLMYLLLKNAEDNA